MKKKYNIWHIEMYHGWYDCDGPSDCNLKDDYVFDASWSKKKVINAMVSQYTDDRVVEMWKCEIVSSGEIEY